MEAAGLAIGVVGLAALVSSCKHLMDQIDSFRHVGSEARPILAEFSASKLIFDRWLQNVDVSGDAVKTADGKPVDEKTAHVLQDLISCIKESLKSIEVVISDFSMSPAEFTQSGDKPALKERPTDLSTKTKFQWAFFRKEKAIKEVQNFYRLIQKLHALIPVSGPSGDTPHKRASTRDPVDELAAHLDKLSERNNADTRRSIDQWLGAKSTESYYEDRLRERQDETCSWIFDRPAFVSWISPEFPDDSAKLLWLHAPPGFGKTILNRFQFLKALRRLISDSKTRILVVSRDSLDIRSALHPEQVEDRATILEVAISKHDVEEDLKSFSKTIVNQKLANRTEDLRTELADQMAERADGMFLWVKLHQSGLRGSKNKKRLQEIISSMPQGLQRTYDKNMDRIKSLESTDRSRAFFILRWLMIGPGMPTVGQIAVGFAVRMSGQGPALQCDELPESVDQVYIDEEILSTCADLVEVKAARPDQPHQYRVLSFIHSSIREYMLQVVPEDTPAISFSDKSFQREQL
ncbi:hypothetical protein SLS56_009056 [Neofusicoccum ribis]|uniref:Ankyrin repeat protein n=1 Tax=Neofusicoccum ribis TaxID=45134 RepID=A0ABR3SIU9_9PEZI